MSVHLDGYGQLKVVSNASKGHSKAFIELLKVLKDLSQDLYKALKRHRPCLRLDDLGGARSQKGTPESFKGGGPYQNLTQIK